MTLLSDINKRLEFGYTKYGHGVDIHQNMGDYTQSGMNSFLEMQLEEIMDGIIYTVCSYLRIKNNIQHSTSMFKHNDLIKKIIDNPELVDILEYKNLLNKMMDVYNDTISLSCKMDQYDIGNQI
jgi:hypothetical protein